MLLDESVMAGTLTEAAGEPTFIRALDEDSFEGARFVFFAGTAADAERNWRAAQSRGATVIDLTGALAARRQRPGSITWIPVAAHRHCRRESAPSGFVDASGPSPTLHPAAPVIVACTLAAGFAKLQPQRIVLLLFPPVSERDQAGVEELESQTANLLSFREIDPAVFDAQVAFNLLARYGEASKPTLAEMRAAIARDVVALSRRPRAGAGNSIGASAGILRVCFRGLRGFASSSRPNRSSNSKRRLQSLGVKVAAPDDPPPTNVSVAGESEIHLARIEPDPNVAGGAWIWGVADNLRLAATNAVRIAEELVAKLPE